jgi:hypothetical protein
MRNSTASARSAGMCAGASRDRGPKGARRARRAPRSRSRSGHRCRPGGTEHADLPKIRALERPVDEAVRSDHALLDDDRREGAQGGERRRDGERGEREPDDELPHGAPPAGCLRVASGIQVLTTSSTQTQRAIAERSPPRSSRWFLGRVRSACPDRLRERIGRVPLPQRAQDRPRAPEVAITDASGRVRC